MAFHIDASSRIQRTIIALGVILFLIFSYIAYSYLQNSRTLGSHDTSADTLGTASTTDEASMPETGSVPRGLPPEPIFRLPAGATSVDEYSFIQDGQVYFRSLLGNDPLLIPNADAQSFSRLSSFITYENAAVQSDCSGPAIYAYYGDTKQVYFYQIWRTDLFRTSQIEVIAGADKDSFRLSGDGKAVSGDLVFEIGYKTEDRSTCKLFLKKSAS